MNKAIGIDLGTTFSAIAYINDQGQPEIICNAEGERIMPSVVFFEDGIPIVGSVAKSSGISDPLSIAQFVKRQIGDPTWKFRTEEGEEYTSEEISALILKRLKEDAESFIGEKIYEVVISVPAYFNDAQRKATQDAGRIAGLNVLRIINEPTAAALAYGIKDNADETQTMLIYDLGGGTFDVTILKIGAGEIQVLASGGDKNLGGFDFDGQLMILLNDEFKKQTGEDLLENPEGEQILRGKAESTKKILSFRNQTKTIVSWGGKKISIPITRTDFENATESLLRRTINISEMVVEDANLQWNALDKIILVGGSTRMRAVSEIIEKESGKKPSNEVHQDEAVAMGAAIQAGLVQVEVGNVEVLESEFFPLVKVNDVASHSLGVVTLDESGKEKNSIVLRKDTPLPSKVSDIFKTVIDWQTELHVQITQGEDEELEYVTIIGETTMRIDPYSKGAPVEVIFEYDLDGIIHISVIDKTSNKFLGEIEIKRISNLSEQGIQEKQEKIRNLAVN